MEKLLTYRKTSLWLLAVYLPTLIVPWILICVLDVRPLNAPSYNDQSGSIPASGLETIYNVVVVIRILNSISGVIVVPVVGTIIAHAAVVFSQRRRPKQDLNLLQLFALADRGWGSIPTLWSAGFTGASSSFLWVAALMTMISSIQQPIQSALVSFETITVLSFLDLPQNAGACINLFEHAQCSGEGPVVVGHDADPGTISLISHNLVVTDVANSIVAVSVFDLQPNLWADNPYADADAEIEAFSDVTTRGRFFWYSPFSNPSESYFASALPNGMVTGVLRQHAIRINSSASCASIPRTNFPATCGGARPVQAAFSNEFIDMRVCAPGEIGTTPWTLSRNRQDISEELYIDVVISPAATDTFSNFTTKCTANSTRGYFELGNYFNGFAYGPLIEDWPAPDVLERDFNDYSADGTQPTVEDHPPSDVFQDTSVVDPFNTERFSVSGPLITAASVLFGNTSFLNIADPHNNLTALQILTQMCQHGSIPFALLGLRFPDFTGYCFGPNMEFDTQTAEDTDSTLATMMGVWVFNQFNDTANAKYVLDMSMFFVNRAVLNKALTVTGTSPFGRPIYTSPGLLLLKPTKTLAGTIIVSVLIAMQLVGLGLLVWYIYSVPAWTSSLNALAVAQIAREVSDGEIPPLGPVSSDGRKRMYNVDALVGVKDGTCASNETLEELGYGGGSKTDVGFMGDKGTTSSSIELTIGGPGLIRRGLVSVI
ncbi:hypothetical protein C8R45DRAFT_832888 [Mycena sanguinolenta]|nr:hypothetical protein C8R45DRAFT_832888 [Mycena sanguinolenta]